MLIGKTALHWAAAVNNEEAARVLIQNHANVDAQDEYNQTALFLAAREGSYQVARILLHVGKANVDLPDHMERFPRDVALERHHRDIAQLIQDSSHGLGTGTLSGLVLPQASASSPYVQASAAKSRSKKSTSQRKQSARSVVGEAGDRLLHNSQHAVEADPARCRELMVPVRAKKTRRQRAPMTGQSVSQSQLESAAKLFGVLDPTDMLRISPEQPPSYENAINGRLAQFAAMQQAASMGIDSHSVYHTGVAFEEPQQFGACPDMTYAEMVGFHQQPTGVVLQPSSYLPGGLVEADPSHMAHNSPTVPICHAYSPQSVSAVQGREATVVSGGQRSQPLSPVHRQMLQQKMQLHQSQNLHYQQHQPRHHSHEHHLQPLQPVTSDSFDASSVALVSRESTVPDITAYLQPMLSSAAASTQIMFQYPTPPSNHSTTEVTSPTVVQQTGGNPPNGYPTPSPERSPGQWSSTPPNSAKSDWSEPVHNNSPRRTITNVQGIKDEPEPAYL